MKKVLAIVLALVFVFSMAAFAESSKTTVTIWHTFTKDQQAYLEKAAADFNATQDKYEVVVVSQAYSGFTDNVKSAVRSGIGPDIIFNYASEAAEYVNDGLVANLSKYIYADDDFADAFDESLAEGVMEGEVKGFADKNIHYLPAYTTGPILFYNKTIYDELGLTVPTTWEEMEANCRVIKEQKGIAGLGFDSLTDCLQGFIMEDPDSTYINVDEKTVGFDTESMKATVQWLADMQNEGLFMLKPTSDYFSNDMSSGLVAGYIGSCAGYPYITMPEGQELGVAPMPAQTWYPSWNRGPIVFYYNDDARAEGAYEFVKYFISADVNLGWVEAVNALAPYSWTQELPAYQEYVAQDTLGVQALNAVAAHLDIAGSLPAVTGASTVRNEIRDAVIAVAYNGVSVEEAWAACVANCNAALQN